MITKTEYKKRIWQYKKRRKKSYEVSRRLSAKIRQMEACLAGRQIREAKIDEKVDGLLKSINDFFVLDIRSSKASGDYKLARNVFYKVGLELQIKETLLCSKVNRRQKAASYGRMALTKSFKSKPENKEAYYNFKNYYKNKLK